MTGEDDFGQPRRLDDPITFTRSSAGQGLGASLPLFDGLARFHELGAARAEARAATARLEAEGLRLDAEVALRFYDALRAARVVALEERLLVSARERLAATEAMLRVARSHPEDVLGARVDVARQEQVLERARGEAEKARLALAELLGVGGDVAFQPDGEPPPLPDPAGLSADSLVAAALAAAPRLRGDRKSVV